MKSTIKYITGIFIVFLAMSCDDMLDRDEQLMLTSDLANTLYSYTEAKAAALYTSLPSGFDYFSGAMMASACDEAEHTLETSPVHKYNTGAWSSIDNPDNAWSRYYIGIRRANLFLETADSVNLDRYALDPNPARQLEYQTRKNNVKRWKYEARFLRAFFYFELVKRYGGVPLITETISLNDDFKNIKRSTLEKCIDFISSECDSAASVLPVTYATTDLGRVTKGAALALKSRVLLFAASDLFNDPSWAPGYANPNLISLPADKTRTERWQAAADAAKAVIDLTGTGYALATNYVSLFKTFNSPEIILVRRAAASNTFERANYPIGYDLGNSGTTPSQNLVDDYEVKVNSTTSVPFDWNDPAHAANPFAGRDPRLGFSILVNGATFKGRQVQSYVGGLDGPGKMLASRTGHYLFKYIDPNLDLLLNKTSVHSWILIRLAEVYLNYAEALNECQPGHPDIAIYLNKVRQRTGVAMPAVSGELSQAEMRDKIRHERRIELAFEEHRPWDARRWMKAVEWFNAPLKGLRITKNTDDSYTYEVINVENRKFEPRMYFYPIPQSELNIAKEWLQNPLWTDYL